MRKLFRILLIVIALACIALVFHTFRSERLLWGDPTALIPPSSEMAVRIDRYSGSSRHRTIEGPDPGQSDLQQTLAAWLDRADSLHAYTQEWNEVLSANAAWLIFPTAANPADWMAVVALREGMKEEIPLLIQGWTGGAISERTFQGIRIIQQGAISFAVSQNCLLWSTRASILEGCLLAGSRDGGDEEWNEVARVASADAAIHYFIKTNSGRLAIDLPSRPGQQWWGGHWTRYEFAQHLEGAEGSFGIHDELPSTTVLLDAWSYRDGETAWRAAARQQPENAETFWSVAWRDLGDSCECDLNEAALSWRSGEFGRAVLHHEPESPVLYFGVRDSLNAMKWLKPLLSDSTRTTAGYIHAIRFPDVFRRNFVGTGWVEAKFLMQKGSYVFIASDPDALALLSGSSLSRQTDYRNALVNVRPHGGRWIYRTNVHSVLIPAPLDFLLGSRAPLAMHVTFGSANYSGVMLWSGGIGRSTSGESAAGSPGGSAWSVKLPAAATGRYWLVRNHHTGHTEMLIEDIRHALHLVDAEGKVLWSYALTEPLLGGVTQLDALRNGKLQMAFNTAKSLHIVDRNGKNLKGFPVRLPSTASCGLAVADYDANRTYRLLVGCANGELLNYSVEGMPTKGWSVFRAEGPVRATGHFRVGNEDFLVSWTDEKLSLLRRTGEERPAPKGKFSGISGNMWTVVKGLEIGQTWLSFIRGDQLVSIRLGDGQEKVMASDLKVPYLSGADVNGDRKVDFMLADRKEFKVFDSSAERMFGITMPGEISGPVVWHSFGAADGRLGIRLTNKEYHLLSFRGESEEGFPLAEVDALIVADFHNDGKQDIVVIREGEVSRLTR